MAPVLPEVPADPDLRFADSNAGDAARKAALNLYDCWTGIERQMQRVTESNKGARINRVVALWESVIQRLKSAQDNANAAATLHDECAEAGRKYRASAPSQEEFDAKRAEYEIACRKVQETADDGGYSYVAAQNQRTKARSEFGDLIARKKAAVEAFEHAEDLAEAKFKAARQPMPQVESGTYGSTPTAPTAPKPDAPAPETAPKTAPAPVAPVGPTEPAVPAPPLPQTLSATVPPAPETVTSSSGSGLDSKSLLAGALLAQQAQQQAPQPQMPPQMPTMPQVPAAGQQQQQNRPGDRDPLTEDDIARLIADTAPGAAVLGGLPLGPHGLGAAPQTITSASPAITPSPAPIYAPAAPWSTTGLAGTAPTNPVVTGTSLSGLETVDNVTGRPDNVAARTAYTATGTTTATGSHLSGTQAGGAAAGGPGTATGTAGVPAAGMPMMGTPMMGAPGGGNGGAAARDPVTAKLDDDQRLLMGLDTVDAAVSGGTIAQKKDDAA